MPQTDGINAATVLKTMPGRVLAVNVTVAGSAASTINDCTTTGAAASSNAKIATPAAAGPVPIPIPINFGTGITVTPGTGQTISVMWE